MKHRELLNKALEQAVEGRVASSAADSIYLGSIAICMADIADKICETEEKDDHYELMKLKSEIFEYIDNRILSLKDNLDDMRSVYCSTDETIVKELARTRNHIDKIFYDYIHMVPEEDEE